MIKRIQKIAASMVLLALSSFVFSAPPTTETAPPYIVLSDNLDEPNGYGFCIDTLSRGKNDLMQAHSCKPRDDERPRDSQDNDVRFIYDSDTKQIASHAYEGMCMQALIAKARGNISGFAFALLECSDAPRQKFIYSEDDKTLRLNEDQGICIGVEPETKPAGPLVARGLVLAKCEELDPLLKQWKVVPE